MIQLDLNLMLACAVRVSKKTRSACAQAETRVFVDLHAIGNSLHVIHKRTVHEGTSLGTQYTPASTSNTQVRNKSSHR